MVTLKHPIAALVKCTLLLGYDVEFAGNRYFQNTEIDISNELQNWDLHVVSQRNGIMGVVNEMTLPFEIVDTRGLYADRCAYVALRQMFSEHGIHSTAKIRIYLRADYTNDYDFEKEVVLDFSEYIEYENYISILGVSTNLVESINSQGNTKYDIPVAEIKAANQFLYNNIEIDCNAEFELPVIDYNPEGTSTDNVRSIVPMDAYFMNIETIQGKSALETTGQLSSQYDENDFRGSQYFLKCHSKTPINVHLKAEFSVYYSLFKPNPEGGFEEENVYIQIRKYNEGRFIENVFNVQVPKTGDTSFTANIKIDQNIVMREGNLLSLVYYNVVVKRIGSYLIFYMCEDFTEFNIDWKQNSGERILMDVIHPLSLAQALLDKMSPDRYTAYIEWDPGEMIEPMFCAAESIRGYENAMIHTSFQDFVKWMKSMAYTYEIDNDTITFSLHEKFFRKDKVIMELNKSEVNLVDISINKELCISRVNIGYNRVDYENTNGKYEINGMFEYSTGFINKQDTAMDLISPYRADHYGIEFLTWERFNKSTDNQSDNDVFVFACNRNSEGYHTFYKDVYQNVNNSRIYNTILNAYFLAQRNKGIIGIINSYITFASTTNNRDAEIIDNGNNLNIYSDFMVSDRLFEPTFYHLSVGTQKRIPKNKNGLIVFEHRDDLAIYSKYKGFIFEISKNYSKEKTEDWFLLVVKD